MSEILKLIDAACGAAREHRFDEAAKQAARVLDRLPTCLRALRVLAWAQLELDDDRTPGSFENCVYLDPEDALAYVGQAIWAQTRDQDEAARHWVRAWELDPPNQALRRAVVTLTGELPESSLADAIGLLRVGGDYDAAGLLRRLHRDSADVVVALSLMDALWASGEQREAFDVAVTVHASHPQIVKAALYVAAMEDRTGRKLLSREALARAEQVDPGLKLFMDVVHQLGLQSAIDLRPVSTAR